MRIETIAVHSGTRVDPGTGAVTPAIHPSTTFERDPDGSYPRGFLYSRNSNPNRSALEECLAALEDHVVAPIDAYHGTSRLLRETFAPWGLDTTFVDMTDAPAVRAAIRAKTRLIWVETPSNPLWKITDIAAIGAIARETGAFYVCDNTTATPVLQSPFKLGADLVLHASTKYLGGHGDVLGGAVVAKMRGELFDRIRALQASGGAVPSPFDCWLVRRGIRTLPYRVRAHAENALRVATFLHGHPRVEAVHYPGLPTHPAHDVARRQMTAFGGMVSVQVRGSRERAMEVAAKLRVFTRATSFGGTESLVEHRASIEGAGTRTPDNLLRLSVGLEHPDDLTDDLGQALS
ncbi:MAG: cystathionine gamma-synthase [Candidatus Rokuibacteriota bacterium]|nr:MAG: cystathionine gamma-synthase [Candidatus Rokubacteria bacterium]